VILDLIPGPYRLLAMGIAAAALAAAGFGAGYKLRGVSADRDINALQAEHSQAKFNLAQDAKQKLEGAIAVERAVREDVEGTANDERTRAAAAEAALSALRAGHDGVRDDLRRYSAARACTTGAAATAASGSATGTSSVVVHADVRDDMLDEAADALRVLAPALDTARSRHADCVAIWDQARARLKRLGEAGRSLEAAP
jgi:hypothetical protein